MSKLINMLIETGCLWFAAIDISFSYTMTSKAEYLKRYMSIESTSNKRKKKEKKPVVDTSR